MAIMSQSERSKSTEANEDDEPIAVWPWVDPDGSDTRGGVDRGQDRVLLASSQVSWAEVRGHLIELYTVTGEKYGLRGTLTNLERRWAKYGFVRIHNSYLVSLQNVRELCPTSGGGREVYLRFGSAGGRYRPVSRRRCPEFKQVWINHIEAQYKKSFR
ncbi:MAG: LytTR family transcriptional regulator [Actinomycetota bacterium]|nr:LytTR family transcriptional regulator [Actinomycetota bacterium]